jgi:hypothetical protein
MIEAIKKISERNHAEIEQVVAGMNGINQQLRTAGKDERGRLLMKWWKLYSTYEYLKWQLEGGR